MQTRKRNQGFTLVELMVSVGLGLLVAAIATQLFVTNLMSFNAQRGIADVQDNGRFAMDFINRDIRQAGLRPAGAILNPYPAVVIETSDMPDATAELITTDSKAGSPGIGPSDQLLIQRLTLEDTVDCEGNAVAADSYVVSRYFLRADAASGSASALVCAGGSHATTAGSLSASVANDGTVLLTSAENFQVLLGVGDAGVPVRYYGPDEYALLAEPRPRILAVRVGVLVSSMDSTGEQFGVVPDLNVLDETVEDIPGDGRIRRIFVTSIGLRNERM